MSNTIHKVTFYPVGNGDCSQIVLENGRRILMDYRHQACGEDKNSPVIDLKATLTKELESAKRNYFDVVAFTHADLDHICGFSDLFHLEYSSTYQGKGRLYIRELWVPAAVLLEPVTKEERERQDEFYILRQEARYRLKQGKGIKVFSMPQEVLDLLKNAGVNESRDDCFVDAGTSVPGFSLAQDKVEFFVHSPFVEHCEGNKDIIRNVASLIFNVRFEANGEYYDYLAVGDTEYAELDRIVEITDYHERSHRYAWDLFNIPHHCSYKALGADKGDKETKPSAGVEKLLKAGKPGAYIVSSSNPIPDEKGAYDQVQPPHIQARNTYEKYRRMVGARKFLVTMEEPNAYRPEPIVFEITGLGIRQSVRTSESFAAASILTAAAPRAGLAAPAPRAG